MYSKEAVRLSSTRCRLEKELRDKKAWVVSQDGRYLDIFNSTGSSTPDIDYYGIHQATCSFDREIDAALLAMSAQVMELEYLKVEIRFVESHLRWYAKACSAIDKAG